MPAAPPAVPVKMSSGDSFDILDPNTGELVLTTVSSEVFVRIQHNHTNNVYRATIADLPGGVAGDLTSLTRLGSSDFYIALIPASNLPVAAPATNNKRVIVNGYHDNGSGPVLNQTKAQDFIAYRPGSSGSSGSSSPQSLRCGFCQADVPIPVELRVEGIAAEAITLRHSGDAAMACSWLSGPIDDDVEGVAYWILEKTAARTWALRYRTEESDVIWYQHTTDADGNCSFPIELAPVDGIATLRKSAPVIVRPGP